MGGVTRQGGQSDGESDTGPGGMRGGSGAPATRGADNMKAKRRSGRQ
jgi:hypothetical protein